MQENFVTEFIAWHMPEQSLTPYPTPPILKHKLVACRKVMMVMLRTGGQGEGTAGEHGGNVEQEEDEEHSKEEKVRVGDEDSEFWKREDAE